MKAKEHQRILKEYVSRKNNEIDVIKFLSASELQFWRDESDMWSDYATKLEELLSQLLDGNELDEVGIKEAINSHPYGTQI